MKHQLDQFNAFTHHTLDHAQDMLHSDLSDFGHFRFSLDDDQLLLWFYSSGLYKVNV